MQAAKGRWAFGLATAGVLWTAALIPGAFYFPAYSGESSGSGGVTTHTSATLVGVNGTWVVAFFVPPVALATIAWFGLHLSCSVGSRRGRLTGRTAAWLLAAFAILTFSVGFLALPAAVLLLVAAALTPAAQAREM
ncbi:MAG TPA: hypothetical protein VKO84_01795 [Gaiellaceae bacterium]|nr:hypothetical protein [Gaiellaceae bacterium]